MLDRARLCFMWPSTSQDKLGHTAVTNNPKMLVAPNTVLFLFYTIHSSNIMWGLCSTSPHSGTILNALVTVTEGKTEIWSLLH